MKSSTLAIIPARYHSSRLPAKMLADIGGKPLIQWVYERVCQSAVDAVIIATDHIDICQAAQQFGAQVMMTSSNHVSGTDRCAEVMQKLQTEGKYYDIIVNVQGDEPFIQPAQIGELLAVFDNPQAQIGTLARRIEDNAAVHNPNIVKVVFSVSGRALYFSRHALPFMRAIATEEWLQKGVFYQHIGLYGFRAETLSQLMALKPSRLELSESLEQLRWLENDYNIHVATTLHPSMGIDTEEDLEKAREFGSVKN